MRGYLELTQKIIENQGIPEAMYTDKHTIVRSPKEDLSIEEQLQGIEQPLTQFGKALKELGIEHIKAHSPQAKGRVERLFRTLQDRLITELAILGVSTMDEANKVLPSLIDKHNSKFADEPADPESAYVPLLQNSSSKTLEQILCYRWGTKKNRLR